MINYYNILKNVTNSSYSFVTNSFATFVANADLKKTKDFSSCIFKNGVIVIV